MAAQNSHSLRVCIYFSEADGRPGVRVGMYLFMRWLSPNFLRIGEEILFDTGGVMGLEL
jgi:hypothetical protein